MSQVKFETITGREIVLDLQPNITFGEIKNILADQYKWAPQNIHLLFDGSDHQDNEKLSTINLESGKRFIVIYVEPTGSVPNIDEMVEMLMNFNPNKELCLEALQKNQYNIERASDYLLTQIPDQSIPPNNNTNNKTQNSNSNNNKVSSNRNEGRRVSPQPNPYVYTPPQTNAYGLTEDEVKAVLKEKPKEMTNEFAFEIFVSAGKDIETFKSFLQ